MTFRQFLENIEDFMIQGQEDLTNISYLAVMADWLEEHGRKELADLIHGLVSNRKGSDAVETDNQTREAWDKHYNDLREKGIYIATHDNEVLYWPNQGEQQEFYHWNGNHIRYRNGRNYSGWRTIKLSSIKNPEIVEALAVLAAIKVWYGGLGAGLPKIRTKGGRRSHSKETRKKIADYENNKEDTMLRAYLEPFLFAVTQIEERLFNIARLRRNNHELNNLASSLHYTVDRRATLAIIIKHLRLHQSHFLKELADRLKSILEQLGALHQQVPQYQQNWLEMQNAVLFRDVERIIRKMQN